MPEKLLTLEETAVALEISAERLKEMVAKGELPAYKVGGQYLRFRKEQIEAIQNEIKRTKTVRAEQPAVKARPKKRIENGAYSESLSDRVLDFLYFKDFYIISGVIIAAIVWFIFKG